MAQEQDKKDWLDRKIYGFLEIVKVMGEDSKTVILTGSVILNFWLSSKLIKTTEDLSETIIQEVRKQSKPLLEEVTRTELAPYKDKLDTTINKVNKVLNTKEEEEGN